jgi:DNA-binding NtrC family response regulator
MSAPKLRFLIVDPLEGVQVFARRLLESYGFEPARIHCCSDTVAALAHGFVEPPDFLLTDWFGKSDPTGMQLYEQLREQHEGCKVGFMSFQITPEIEAAAQAMGSRFLLKKPFDADQLKRTLQNTFSWLAQANPALMARVATESQGRLDPRQRRIELPPVPPPLRHGETVRLNGKTHRVQAVVIRHGEQLAQLDGLKDLVPATRLSR